MGYNEIDKSDLLFELDIGFGPEVALISSPRMVSVCAPCKTHHGRLRRAAKTGLRDFDPSFPNLCQSHLARFKRGQEWDVPLASGRPVRNQGECALDDCEASAYSKGLCKTHAQREYRRLRREGVKS